MMNEDGTGYVSPLNNKVGGKNVFEYHSLRAKKARLGNKLNHNYVKIPVVIIMLISLALAVFALVMREPLGWLGLALFTMLLVVSVYAKLELFKVPSGKTEDLNDILSHNIMANLDEHPTPRNIAKMIIKTNSGKFLAYRFGISPQMLEFLASTMSDDPTPVFQKAREVRGDLHSGQISGGMLAIAMVACFPDYENLLGRMKLELKDLYDGMNWYNYVHGLVLIAKRRRRDGGIARDFSFGYIPLLSRFGQNISVRRGNSALKTQIHLASHREIVIKMIETFSGGGRQNVALIGPAGSGRRTIVNAFAEEILDADSKIVPNNLKFRQIFMLDASALISAAAGRGEIEGLLNSILNEAYAAKNIIIYLANAHLFFEEGVGSVDISNLLIPILEAGNLKMILTLDEQKYLEISARKPALTNALNKIMVEPGNEAETMATMEDRVPMLEYQYRVTYTWWALKESYRLSERYIHDLAMPGRALNLLEMSAKYANQGFVLAESVQEAIEKTQGVKVQVATNEDERAKLLNLEELIHQRMVDQVEAVKTVSDALRRAAAGVRNENRPIGTFLFLGPTGVGKTELAKAISDVYFGGESQIVRIDLNEYVEAADVARLIAEPSVDPMSLTAQISKQPFSVVLLDEIEKAHPQVLTTLLQMLDEGILRDTKNNEVSFRDAIIVATSNAGADTIRQMIMSGQNPDKETLTNQLITSGEFRPEFLNRLDEICVFKPLSKEDLLKVVDIIIASVNKTLTPQKISVVLDEPAKMLLVERGYDPRLGARPMRRIIQKTVENLVAKAVLSGTVGSGAVMAITQQDIEGQLG